MNVSSEEFYLQDSYKILISFSFFLFSCIFTEKRFSLSSKRWATPKMKITRIKLLYSFTSFTSFVKEWEDNQCWWTDSVFSFFPLNMMKEAILIYYISFKGQVTFPAMLRWVYNPLLASQRELQWGNCSQEDDSRDKCYRTFHFSQTSKILPFAIFLLYFKLGLSAWI